MELTEKQKENLGRIIEAGEEGTYTVPMTYGPLLDAGFVEINAEMKKGSSVATRATQAGIDYFNNFVAGSSDSVRSLEVVGETMTEVEGNVLHGAAAGTAGTATTVEKPVFTLESNIPVPSFTVRKKPESYPFDQMDTGQSFFVPDTEKKPNAAKSLASTVSSATARYAVPKEPAETRKNRKGKEVPVMVEIRKFIVRKVTENGVSGARVWRVK